MCTSSTPGPVGVWKEPCRRLAEGCPSTSRTIFENCHCRGGANLTMGYHWIRLKKEERDIAKRLKKDAENTSRPPRGSTVGNILRTHQEPLIFNPPPSPEANSEELGPPPRPCAAVARLPPPPLCAAASAPLAALGLGSSGGRGFASARETSKEPKSGDWAAGIRRAPGGVVGPFAGWSNVTRGGTVFMGRVWGSLVRF